MSPEVEELLAPVAPDNPAGEDLSYDAERQTIELRFDTSISDDEGESDVNWRETIDLIVAQSARTKDVWLPVYLCRAGARAGLIEVVETGAQYLGGLLERYWDSLHPGLDEYGFQGRKGPCEGLTRIGEFIGPLRRIPLILHPRLGQFSGSDLERFRDRAESEDDYGLFRAALNDLGEEPLFEVMSRIENIVQGIQRADAVLTANAVDDTGTNFRPTYDALESLRRAVAHFTSAPVEEEASPGGADEGARSAGSAAGGAGLKGAVESRDDVIRALDAIGDYYRRREPGSPVPFALARAREWVNSDFLSVMQDIAPAGMDEVRRILMPTPKPDE